MPGASDIAIRLLSSIGSGAFDALDRNRQQQRDHRLRAEEQQRFEQARRDRITGRNKDAARDILTRALSSDELRSSAVEDLNSRFGVDLRVDDSNKDLDGQLGQQLIEIAERGDLTEDQRRNEFFRLAANNKGLTFSDAQAFIDSRRRSANLDSDLSARKSLENQRDESAKLSRARRQKILSDVIGNKKLEDMTLEELQDSARKVASINSALMTKGDFGGTVIEGAEDAFEVYQALQDDIAAEVQRRRGVRPEQAPKEESSQKKKKTVNWVK